MLWWSGALMVLVGGSNNSAAAGNNNLHKCNMRTMKSGISNRGKCNPCFEKLMFVLKQTIAKNTILPDVEVNSFLRGKVGTY